MNKRISFAGVAAVFMFLTAAGAHALSFSGISTTLIAGDTILLAFPPAAGNLTSAVLTIDISSLKTTTLNLYGCTETITVNPCGMIAMGVNQWGGVSYLFTPGFDLGTNNYDMGNYLFKLNSASPSRDLSLQLLMLRGSITFSNARLGRQIDGGPLTFSNAQLHSPVAPEPFSMALMGVGMAGLPFARRLRKKIAA